MSRRNWRRPVAVLAVVALVGVAAVAGLSQSGRIGGGSAQSARFTHAMAGGHALPVSVIKSKLQNGGEATGGPAQEAYDNLAFPNTEIAPAQVQADLSAFEDVSKHDSAKTSAWQEVGPTSPLVVSEATYTGRPTYNSGRTTAIAVRPNKCDGEECALLIGTAGGGVWRTSDALADRVHWKSSNDGIPSTAIGSLAFDPNDASGKTVYAGTGEPNGSSDSEAGVGLYKSTNGGKSWSVVPGSVSVATGRSVGAVAVDPKNPNHIYIGTAVARHGSSSVNGGRFTPPGSQPVGLYESTDGGATFRLAYAEPSDTVNPNSANGSDFFRGGVTNIQFAGSTVYFAIMDYGLYRSAATGYERIFDSDGGGSPAATLASRTEFALAPLPNKKLRIYVGDTGTGKAKLYRTDDAGASPIAWTQLPAGADYCGGQCSYDMPVASPPGRPDEVWIGGQMQYREIFSYYSDTFGRSNGRAVQRSVDAGATFTDMTNDTQSPPLGMHPDQHGMAFSAANSGIAFLASDGGVVRTSGQFADASGDCATRNLSPANLAFCQGALKSVPTRIYSLNDGLGTLQFQSVSVGAGGVLMGGTQDNGTWAFDPKGKRKNQWFESIGGDGGQSGVNPADSSIRFHNYYDATPDVNFSGAEPLGWDWIADPLYGSDENRSFYVPMSYDPKAANTIYAGLEHVWRTQDNGGDRAYLDKTCNEYTGTFAGVCGDWTPIGQNLVAGPSSDKGTGYVVAIAGSDGKTLWAGTRRGRLFISTNADKADAAVSFTRIDTSAQPRRFVSGIAVDPANTKHAFVSFSGYDAYTPATPGHVFEVTYNGATATWVDRSYNLGDQPITDVALEATSGDLYAATDWGVLVLRKGSTVWRPAAANLPPVAVYGLTLDASTRTLYAATHGRGIWKLDLSGDRQVQDDH